MANRKTASDWMNKFVPKVKSTSNCIVIDTYHCECCDKSFKSEDALIRHLDRMQQKQIAAKLYEEGRLDDTFVNQCKYCGKIYTYLPGYEGHMKWEEQTNIDYSF